MAAPPFRHHIVTAYDRELARLRALVRDMGERALEQTRTAVEALLTRDLNAARRVLAREPGIDQMNLEADEEIFALIVRNQPTASDLRLVLALSKVVGELERSGDKAVRIAQAVMRLLTGDPPQLLSEDTHDTIRELESLACYMLEHALMALANADLDQAITVFETEAQLERVTERVQQLLLTTAGPELPAAILADLIIISHALERLGHHGTNIAEQVVYVVRGNDVRYRNRELLIDALRHGA